MDIKVNENMVICFDLDDTLYNELQYLKSAYVEIAKVLEATKWTELYGRMFSLYRKKENVFEYLATNYKVEITLLLDIYRNHNPRIKPFDGVTDLLTDLKHKDGKLCIITDGRSITQRNKLKALGLTGYFDKIIVSEEIGSEKPSLKNYLIIEKTFPGCSYTYVADNFKKDFIVPNKRGWKSIGVLDNGMNIHNNTYDFFKEEFCPQNIIHQISDLKIV